MAAAVLTPRVRLITLCDRVRESDTEAGVYHLRGVRQRIVAQAFPFVAFRLWLFWSFQVTFLGPIPAISVSSTTGPTKPFSSRTWRPISTSRGTTKTWRWSPA
jgi:hypothetical protein